MVDTLFIDSGKRLCGWAVYRHSLMVDCGLWREASKNRSGAVVVFPLVSKAVVEMAQAYQSNKQSVPADPNDLIAISTRGGWLAGKMAPNAELETWQPFKWKGNIPGDTMSERIVDKLSGPELRILERCGAPPYLLHNVVDAVGMGLREANRL